MAIHATERTTNVRARAFTLIQGWTISGTPDLIFENQERTQGDADPFIRVTIEDLPGRNNGRIGSTTSTEENALIAFDLFWPETTADAYAIDRAKDDLLYELRLFSATFIDYSADPESPAAVPGYPIFVTDPPVAVRISSVNGFDRRRVSARLRWFTSHS